jgi:hypothetical protein
MEPDAPSFERIDYSLRPAKSTERWMLLEALGRLSAFSPLSTYQYVGFGSPFFVDFRLFHRRLGITKMASIEKEKEDEPRFELNKPFDRIDMLYGRSSERLPDVDWSLPTIAWLDYDTKLESSVLSDIAYATDRAKHGDCLVITVDAEPPTTKDGVRAVEAAIGDVAEQLGSPESLAPWGLANHFYELMDSTVVRTLRERGARLRFEQLWRFHYRDTARMLTFGGVFVDERDEVPLRAAGFDDLSFTRRRGDDAFVLLMPRLTLLETARIDRYMPDDVDEAVADLAAYAIRDEHVRRYARIYRHAPVFHESQV